MRSCQVYRSINPSATCPSILWYTPDGLDHIYTRRKKQCVHRPLDYNQYTKPNITATSPALMPAISFPPLALPFFVLVALAALPVALPVAVPVLLAALPLTCCVWPTLGNLTSPSTSHPPAVLLGQAGGVRVDGLYAEDATPVGVKVFHCDCKFVKSGDTGVGVPVREMPAWTPEATTVAATVVP